MKVHRGSCLGVTTHFACGANLVDASNQSLLGKSDVDEGQELVREACTGNRYETGKTITVRGD